MTDTKTIEQRQILMKKNNVFLSALKRNNTSIVLNNTSLVINEHDDQLKKDNWLSMTPICSQSNSNNNQQQNDELCLNNNDNGYKTHLTNMSYNNVFPYAFQHDTLLSFTLDNNPNNFQLDPIFTLHLTNDSFHPNYPMMPIDDIKNPVDKENNDKTEETLISSKRQSEDDNITIQDSDDNDTEGLIYQRKESHEEKSYCFHEDCDIVFRTLKQKLAHHQKMSPECKHDSVQLIKAIGLFKTIINNINKRKKIPLNKLSALIKKYKQIMKSVSLSEHVELFAGHSLEL